MLEKANHILRTGSVEDIKNFIPDLLQTYCKLDMEATQKEKDYEIERIRKYVELKKEKKDKNNNYSDKDIDYISKKSALDKYGDYSLNKRVAGHYRMYIDELRNQVINLNVLNKAMRESINN